MTNELTVVKSPVGERGIQMRTVSDLFDFAGACMQARDMIPPRFKTESHIVVACQLGMEIGMTPMASLRSIYIVNNTPTVYGDAVAALADPYLEYPPTVEWEGPEWVPGKEFKEFNDAYTCVVTVQRKGAPKPHVETLRVADCKRAGWWGKSGPWSTTPKRMMLHRCRTYAIREVAPGALMGLMTDDEARDLPKQVDAEVIDDQPETKPKSRLARVFTPEPKPEPEPGPEPKPEPEPEQEVIEAEASVVEPESTTLEAFKAQLREDAAIVAASKELDGGFVNKIIEEAFENGWGAEDVRETLLEAARQDTGEVTWTRAEILAGLKTAGADLSPAEKKQMIIDCGVESGAVKDATDEQLFEMLTKLGGA